MNSFYNYVMTKNTENTKQFHKVFNELVLVLPNKKCSSKIIYNVLKNHYLDNNLEWTKEKDITLKKTYLEYFRNLFN